MAFDIGPILMKVGMVTSSDYVSIVSINIFVALLCACIVIGHLLEETKWLNESTTALMIGLFTGGVILLSTKGRSSRILVFSEDLFFIYVLPPIIFNAGFQVKKKQFFRNFLTIMLFGAVGTLISFVIISLGAYEIFGKLNIGSLGIEDFLAIGAIFSATDSVCTLQVLNQDETPLLYSLVFGEGVVNDATSVVLFNAIKNLDLGHVDAFVLLKFILNFLYLFSTSTLLGLVTGLLSAFIIKKLSFGRHSTDREVSIMILMAYLSYMLAELLDLSGILTVFFCGIVMSHYTWHNVTESSRITTKHVFATMSFISETFLFLYVGMDALDIERWKLVSDSPFKLVSVSSILIGLVFVGRAAFVFPLSFLSNLRKPPQNRIGFNQQVTIWWSGLMRGAVSMALAYNQFTKPDQVDQSGNAFMITSTITIVLFSTVVFGLLTKPLVGCLVPSTSRHLSSMLSFGPEPPTNGPKSFLSMLLGHPHDSPTTAENGTRFNIGAILTRPSRSVHHYWRKFDDAFMRPVFGGRGFVPFAPASPTERQGVPSWDDAET